MKFNNKIFRHIVGGYFLTATLASNLLVTPVAYAADCRNTSQTWLAKAGNLIQDPITWVQYITGVLIPVFLIYAFFKFKTSRGRQQKVEEGMNVITWLIAGDILIFGVTFIGDWLVGKLC